MLLSTFISGFNQILFVANDSFYNCYSFQTLINNFDELYQKQFKWWISTIFILVIYVDFDPCYFSHYLQHIYLIWPVGISIITTLLCIQYFQHFHKHHLLIFMEFLMILFIYLLQFKVHNPYLSKLSINMVFVE